jgi:8-oxo-dGTP diphosphatase
MPYQPILATLVYVMSPDGERVLLIHRNARPDDHHYGKYNGLGGKLDAGESLADGARRELREEAGIEATSLTLRGTLSWPGFGKHGEDWMGFIFRVDAFEGTPLAGGPEGELEWVPLSRLLNGDLNLWEGDRHFLPLVFDSTPGTFHGLMPYRDGRPVSWSYSRVH